MEVVTIDGSSSPVSCRTTVGAIAVRLRAPVCPVRPQEPVMSASIYWGSFRSGERRLRIRSTKHDDADQQDQQTEMETLPGSGQWGSKIRIAPIAAVTTAKSYACRCDGSEIPGHPDAEQNAHEAGPALAEPRFFNQASRPPPGRHCTTTLPAVHGSGNRRHGNTPCNYHGQPRTLLPHGSRIRETATALLQDEQRHGRRDCRLILFSSSFPASKRISTKYRPIFDFCQCEDWG